MSEPTVFHRTYRRGCVLAMIAENPGASNREVADEVGIRDRGQASKLLKRLAGFGLIENAAWDREPGEANAWRLTPAGETLLETIETGEW